MWLWQCSTCKYDVLYTYTFFLWVLYFTKVAKHTVGTVDALKLY